MALKTDFDDRSNWMVLVRALTGAILGTVPGVLYLLIAGAGKENQPFAVMMIQTGSMIGTLAFGLAALSGTIVAAQKSRGTGPKPTRLKEYTHPNPLPAIPPASKPEGKTVDKAKESAAALETPLGKESLPQQLTETRPGSASEAAGFEDYDR